jgi:sugar/nucleoside kinase (ribokinase family)
MRPCKPSSRPTSRSSSKGAAGSSSISPHASAGTIYVAGNVNVDLILGTLTQWPRIGTETILPHSELRVGGQGGNAGLALAALGARHRIVASTGTDALGSWLAEAFPDSAQSWPRAGATSITVGIVHAGGERTFLTTLGHLAALSPQEMLAQLPSRACPGDAVLLCGVFLSPLVLDAAPELLRTVKAQGYATALDTGWPDRGWDAVRERLQSCLPLLDHVLLNEIETMGLAAIDDLEPAARWICERMAPGATLVVKCGVQGVRAWQGHRVHAREAPMVTVVDTVGAGDVFNAGYLYALQNGFDLDAALELGVATASRAISTSPRQYVAASISGLHAASAGRNET